MNIYSLGAFLFAIVVFFLGLRLSSDKLTIFLDYPSLFIVLGGTIAAVAISVQFDRVFMLFKVFFKRVIMGKKPNYKMIITDLMKISDDYRKTGSLEQHINKADDAFLKEALTLVQDDILDDEELFNVLDERVNNMYYLYMEDSNRIKSIGKFPPAMGMMGTSMGMVVLLSNLGGADAMKMLGPAMSVCILTTLYGTVIANFLFLPVADNLVDSTREIFLKNQIIVAGVKLLKRKTNPVVVAEKLNSFLAPNERLDWKQVLGK